MKRKIDWESVLTYICAFAPMSIVLILLTVKKDPDINIYYTTCMLLLFYILFYLKKQNEKLENRIKNLENKDATSK